MGPSRSPALESEVLMVWILLWKDYMQTLLNKFLKRAANERAGSPEANAEMAGNAKECSGRETLILNSLQNQLHG